MPHVFILKYSVLVQSTDKETIIDVIYAFIVVLQITSLYVFQITLLWRHNGPDGVSYHQPHNCLLSRIFRRRWKNTSKLRVTGFWAGNSPRTGEFPAQMASNAENVSIWWRLHDVWLFQHYMLTVISLSEDDYVSNIWDRYYIHKICRQFYSVIR